MRLRSIRNVIFLNNWLFIELFLSRLSELFSQFLKMMKVSQVLWRKLILLAAHLLTSFPLISPSPPLRLTLWPFLFCPIFIEATVLVLTQTQLPPLANTSSKVQLGYSLIIWDFWLPTIKGGSLQQVWGQRPLEYCSSCYLHTPQLPLCFVDSVKFRTSRQQTGSAGF